MFLRNKNSSLYFYKCQGYAQDMKWMIPALEKLAACPATWQSKGQNNDKLPQKEHTICSFFSLILDLAIMEGYPTFIISIVFIGMNTAVIGDVAGNLGCFIYLKDCVNAIAFVALGTSVPGRTCMWWYGDMYAFIFE